MSKHHDDFTVILDNAGYTLQTSEYSAHFGAEDAAQLAETIRDYEQHGDTSGWDGDDPSARHDYDKVAQSNGGYAWITGGDLLEGLTEHDGWHNARALRHLLASAQIYSHMSDDDHAAWDRIAWADGISMQLQDTWEGLDLSAILDALDEMHAQ